MQIDLRLVSNLGKFLAIAFVGMEAAATFAADSAVTNSQPVFAEQVQTESESNRASCAKFKSSFSELEAETPMKGRRLLKSSADVEKAIALIDQFEVSPRQTELSETFMKSEKPTKTDVYFFIEFSSSGCDLRILDGIIRTVETAGKSGDSLLKDKTRAMIQRWFAKKEKRSESWLSTATIPVVFDRAMALGVFKGAGSDQAFAQLQKEVRAKSKAFSHRSHAELVVAKKQEQSTNIEALSDAEKLKRAENYQFDPIKVQALLREEDAEAKKIKARLKLWLANR